MHTLRAIEAENFLSLRDVSVKLGKLNVLVGPNGAGKSNLLSVLRFLGDVARLDLHPALVEFGGLDAMRFRARRPRGPVRIAIEATFTRHAHASAPDRYELKLHPLPGGAVKRDESFTFKRTRGPGRRITLSGSTLSVVEDNKASREADLDGRSAALSTVQRLGKAYGADQVRDFADLLQTFRVFDVDVERARRPSALQKSPSLLSNASNLAAWLRWLSEAHDDVFSALEDDVRLIVPGFREFTFVPVGGSDAAYALHLVEHALNGSTPLARASFGTVRAVALLAMLHDPNPPALTCVEEIDHGLHPYALDRIVERLRDASHRTQLLIATHSPSLVNRLEPHELILCERELKTGASRIPARDPEEVAAMASADELSLGELWFTGALGGVP